MSTARANTKIPRNFRNIDSSPHPLESAAQRNRVPVKRSAVLNFASDANEAGCQDRVDRHAEGDSVFWLPLVHRGTLDSPGRMRESAAATVFRHRRRNHPEGARGLDLMER